MMALQMLLCRLWPTGLGHGAGERGCCSCNPPAGSGLQVGLTGNCITSSRSVRVSSGGIADENIGNELTADAASFTRRMSCALCVTVLCTAAVGTKSAQARDRRNKKDIPLEDFRESLGGLKYFDVIEGNGPIVGKGERVLVHFDCVFRNITAVSSRESKILGGNRIIAQPYEFTVGSLPGSERKRNFVENANGLFSAQAAPKPPSALYSITEGMRVGGKRTVIVPPEAGYGKNGLNEIPPGATFELNIELLEVQKPGAA